MPLGSLITRRTALLGISGALVAGIGARARAAGQTVRAGASADGDALDAFLDLLARHRTDVGLVSYEVRDGRPAPGRPQVWHGAGRLFPVASSVKLLHLTAYAHAAVTGTVHEDQPVRLGGWEAYLLPRTDGGAHEEALRALGIPAEDGHAADPRTTVTLDQQVSAMIEQSDNAAADHVRHRLGVGALARAARRAGHVRIDPVPSLLGQMLLGFAEDSPFRGTDGIRRLAALPARRRFALADERERRYVAGHRPALRVPGYDGQAAWTETTYGMSPRLLAGLAASAVAGRDAAAALARRHLEWPMRQGGHLPPGLARVGTKGGSLPGALSEASYTVADDGSTRVTAITLHNLPASDWGSLVTSFVHQKLIFRMGVDPAFVSRVARVLEP